MKKKEMLTKEELEEIIHLFIKYVKDNLESIKNYAAKHNIEFLKQNNEVLLINEILEKVNLVDFSKKYYKKIFYKDINNLPNKYKNPANFFRFYYNHVLGRKLLTIEEAKELFLIIINKTIVNNQLEQLDIKAIKQVCKNNISLFKNINTKYFSNFIKGFYKDIKEAIDKIPEKSDLQTEETKQEILDMIILSNNKNPRGLGSIQRIKFNALQQLKSENQQFNNNLDFDNLLFGLNNLLEQQENNSYNQFSNSINNSIRSFEEIIQEIKNLNVQK